jgi:hypothetical protein
MRWLVVAAFGVFVYRAETVEVEPLYYFLGFCGFILLLRMLIAPLWWLAMLAGAATALAYLTKASMLPTIAIWSVVFAAQVVSECRSRGRLHEIVLAVWTSPAGARNICHPGFSL